MEVRVWISELHFNDGTVIPLSKDDIVVLVGPNNSGKSVSLKEASKLLNYKVENNVVLKRITIDGIGQTEELHNFLEEISPSVNSTTTSYVGYNFNIEKYAASMYWSDFKSGGLNSLFHIFVNTLTTEKRISAANPPRSIKLTSDANQHPIHFLQKDDSLERRFSEYFRQAFGLDLLVHRNAGSEVPLYVGEKPLTKEGEDRLSIAYQHELEKLDLLHLQGDGMRSFVGVLLHAFISYHSIVFIDEPEAFLHPPQARLLGKMLAKDLPAARQLFLATHSEDFLKGLLDADVSKLKIIRIQRDGKINRVCSVTSADIKSIWNDSLLRHSNVLGGLFHSKVVICESDSDCRFFSALMHAQYENEGGVIPDVLFIHCGGKHRIPTAVKALKKLNVPIKVVTDFDVLNDSNPLRDIFENLGGVWLDIESDWKLVKSSIEEKRPEFLTSDLKAEIEKIIGGVEARIFPKAKVTEIQKALKKASAWSEAKEVGKAFIPSGDATKAFERLQLKLKSLNLLVLEVGEVESFVKSVGNHGPKWVSEVLEKDLKKDSELEIARQFVRQLSE